MIKKFLVFGFLALIYCSVFAQTDYNRQYASAKALFSEGKYALAMESFKSLITYDQDNPYPEYASFYYALAAYKQGYRSVAKDMLMQIRKLYPEWDKTNEVNFWLGKIHFENGDYFQALRMFGQITDKRFREDIQIVKAQHLSTVSDIETLNMMLEDYPDDRLVAERLATLLASQTNDAENRERLEGLIRQFNLERSRFIPEAPKTIYKDQYSVSLLLPFMVSTLEPTPGRKRNQLVLDFYDGIRLALDTLQKQGVNISLRAYDTERNTGKLGQLLETRELQNTDLIIGPLFPEEIRIVQDFSLKYQVNVVNPFSSNTENIGMNPHAFLFQPSSETLGRKSAEFLASRSRKKNCMVFYGSTPRDSVMAANFLATAPKHGLTIIDSVKVSNQDAHKIIEILASPTEFDEFNYPIEFSLKKDSLSSIFVASDDPLIYSNVVSAVETRGDSILVLGSENWLDDKAIDLEQYQNLGIVLAAPNFSSLNDPDYKAFRRAFINKHGRVPNHFAKTGYEMMLFFGNQLKTNGVYFQEGLSKAGIVPGYLYEGFDYRYTRDNNLIPFIRFKRGELVVIEKR